MVPVRPGGGLISHTHDSSTPKLHPGRVLGSTAIFTAAAPGVDLRKCVSLCILQYTTVYYSILQYTTVHYITLHLQVHLSTLFFICILPPLILFSLPLPSSPFPYLLLPPLSSSPSPYPLLPPLILFPLHLLPPFSPIPPPSSPQSHCTAVTGSVQRSQSETWDAPHDEQQALSSSHETSTLQGDSWVETETAASILCWHCCWRHRF